MALAFICESSWDFYSHVHNTIAKVVYLRIISRPYCVAATYYQMYLRANGRTINRCGFQGHPSITVSHMLSEHWTRACINNQMYMK